MISGNSWAPHHSQSQLSALLVAMATSAAVVTTSTSCGHLPKSSVKIVNGTDAPRSIHPWTYKISFENDPRNLCTGTFVSHNVMLTAAHCVSENDQVSLSELGNVRSLSSHPYPPGIIGTNWIESPNDVGIIIFPDNTSQHFASITAAAPSVGDPIEILGYGSCEDFLGDRDGFRRCVGWNQISRIDPDTRIVTRSDGGQTLSKGDSGGPLFNQRNEIAGVANATVLDDQGKRKFLHTNLMNRENRDWLEQIARSNGVEICGITRGCESTDPNPGVEEDGKKAQRISEEFTEILSKRSPNCSFEVSRTALVGGDESRYRIFIDYVLGQKPKELIINFSTLVYDSGSDLYKQLVERSLLESSFSECDFET